MKNYEKELERAAKADKEVINRICERTSRYIRPCRDPHPIVNTTVNVVEEMYIELDL